MKHAVTTFEFSDADKKLIEAALKLPKPWECPSVVKIKTAIKDFHLGVSKDVCCYCQRELHGEFTMVVDAEHVLPISKPEYKPLAFTIWNLSASCKRCNMLVKKDKVDFLDPSVKDIKNSQHYKLAHPNFDEAEDHLMRAVSQMGKTRIVKYVVVTADKGRFTYDFFRLKDLELALFDAAQRPQVQAAVERASKELMHEQVAALPSYNEATGD